MEAMCHTLRKRKSKSLDKGYWVDKVRERKTKNEEKRKKKEKEKIRKRKKIKGESHA